MHSQLARLIGPANRRRLGGGLKPDLTHRAYAHEATPKLRKASDDLHRPSLLANNASFCLSVMRRNMISPRGLSFQFFHWEPLVTGTADGFELRECMLVDFLQPGGTAEAQIRPSAADSGSASSSAKARSCQAGDSQNSTRLAAFGASSRLRCHLPR